LLLPGPGTEVLTMLCTERTRETGFLLVALEFRKCCQQRPDKAVLEAYQAIAAPRRRFKIDPALKHAFGFRRFLIGSDAPIGGLGRGKLRLQHVAHLIATLDGLDVPGEGDEVAPVALFGEEVYGILDAAGFEGGTERIKKRLYAGGGGFLEHGFSSCYLPAREQQAACQTALSLFHQPLTDWFPPPHGQMQQVACNRCCSHCISSG